MGVMPVELVAVWPQCWGADWRFTTTVTLGVPDLLIDHTVWGGCWDADRWFTTTIALGLSGLHVACHNYRGNINEIVNGLTGPEGRACLFKPGVLLEEC
jgi:hypothetical protein